jgi:hypothetical protein
MTKQKELLIDTASIRFTLQESGGGRLKASGVFARSGVPTANGRVYPESVWRKNIARLQREITENKVLFELDHPADGKTKLQRVAGKITHLSVDDDGTVHGELEVVEGTPNGDILSALIDANCTVGVSSRGYGSVKMNEQGKDVVQDDFNLLTFDVVTDPANATSWPEFTRDGDKEDEEEDNEVDDVEESKNTDSGDMLIKEDDAPKKKQGTRVLIKEDAFISENEKVIESLKQENVALTRIAKELGFSLFIERNLNQHPRYKEIFESLGDLKQYDSLDELKNLLNVHIEDAKEYQRRRKIEESYNLTKLEQEFRMTIEELHSQLKEKGALVAQKTKELNESNSRLASLKKDVETVKIQLNEAKARVYLESKIATHPKAFRIRKLWESARFFENSKIDLLIESLTEVESVTESKTFDSVRQSLRRRGVRENLVESSVSGTLLEDAQKNFHGVKTPETEFLTEEFEVLAGMKKDR